MPQEFRLSDKGKKDTSKDKSSGRDPFYVPVKHDSTRTERPTTEPSEPKDNREQR